MKRILIVGNLPNPHLVRLVKHTIECNVSKDYTIDGFSFNKKTNQANLKLIGYNKIYILKQYFPTFLYNISKIRFLFSLIDFLISFKKVKDQYDLINIHYLTIESFFLYHLYRKKSEKIMLSPWGSDVYRIPFYYNPFFSYLYKKVDLISLPDIKFKYDVCSRFNFNIDKIVNLGFGSEMVDKIKDGQCSREDAKKQIGLEDKFVIVCGYNANINQNHLQMIEAICDVKDQLKDGTHLIFLMTYNQSSIEYVELIEKRLQVSGFDFTIYKEFISNNSLYYIQKATDIFIHIQKTDAFSATVQENILCNNIVINGSWLRYPQIEIDTIPYVLVSNVKDLSENLSELAQGKKKVEISNLTKDYIIKSAWSYMSKKWNDFYKSI